MLSIEIFDSWPVYLCGLTVQLRSLGFEIATAATSTDLGLSRGTDLFLIDPQSIPDPSPFALLKEAVDLAPTFLIVPDDADLDARYTACGLRGLLKRSMDVVTLAQTLHTLTGSDARGTQGPVASAAPGDDVSADVLSKREQQVLTLISQGKTHYQIARSLCISPHTVDTYVRRIRTKLDLGNKAELTRIAVLRTLGIQG